jgi:adenine-specific DNA-methyltransferase
MFRIEINNLFYIRIMTDNTEQLITYLGNKRKLVPYIEKEIITISKILGKEKMSIFEPFCGSTSVSRMLKNYSNHLVVNDLEEFCTTIAKCYLANPSEEKIEKIKKTISLINKHKFSKAAPEFIRKHYAPKNDLDIKEGERVYYTQKNAHIIDTFCHNIFNHMSEEDRPFYLAPLLVEASIHTNTSGTFNSYHKKDGIGHFGGKGENALKRILGEIEVPMPFFTVNDCQVDVYNMDANKLVKELKKERFDVAYLDPPYNKHPYGTNFFMLNIINRWDPDLDIPDNHRGQPDDWKRSKYNSFSDASKVFEELIRDIPATFIILSYNNEGIISEEDLKDIMEKYGTVTKKEIVYPTYKGCKNLASRNKDVIEYLWILHKN